MLEIESRLGWSEKLGRGVKLVHFANVQTFKCTRGGDVGSQWRKKEEKISLYSPSGAKSREP